MSNRKEQTIERRTNERRQEIETELQTVKRVGSERRGESEFCGMDGHKWTDG